MGSIGPMLLGRVTYGMFAGYWPNVTEGDEKGFADTKDRLFADAPTRPVGQWGEATIVQNSAVDEVAKLKQGSGGDVIVCGSISLAQSLIREALIDAYRLVVCPVVLGAGRRLFADVDGEIELRLINAATLDRGAVSMKYLQRTP